MKTFLAAFAAFAFLAATITHAQDTQSGAGDQRIFGGIDVGDSEIYEVETDETFADMLAMAVLIDIGIAAYDVGDYALAMDIWLPLAEEKGNVNAAQWFHLAAKQGHSLAQDILGTITITG